MICYCKLSLMKNNNNIIRWKCFVWSQFHISFIKNFAFVLKPRETKKDSVRIIKWRQWIQKVFVRWGAFTQNIKIINSFISFFLYFYLTLEYLYFIYISSDSSSLSGEDLQEYLSLKPFDFEPEYSPDTRNIAC